MLESERLAYLDALGITQFVSLAPIAGASSLPELVPEQIWAEAPEAVDPPVVDSPSIEEQEKVARVTSKPEPFSAPQSQPDVETKPAPLPEVEDEKGVPQLDLSKLNLETEDTKPAAKPQVKAQQFALAVITIPDQYRLFVELELADAPGLSAVEHRMISDVLMLLGQPGGLDEFGAKLYRWPMVNNPRIAADTQAAREGLLGFVASAPAVSRNVFLGLKAASVLTATAPGQLFSMNQASDPDSLATYSLAEMRQDWRHKSAFWHSVLSFLNNPQ